MGLGNQFLAHIRRSDAVTTSALFDTGCHPRENRIDPLACEVVETE